METERLKQVLEAALMITEAPLSLDRLMGLFEEDDDPPKRDKVRRTLEELEVDYENAGIELVQVASGYRFQARAEIAPWMNRLFEERRPKYSRALLETLAIIAYRQPITRGEIESIRGVAVSTGIVRTLLEREWVRVVGHRDVPGKPAVYATTKSFLDYFNLASIDDLPSLAELKDFDDINADLFRDQNIDEGGEGRAEEPAATETQNLEPSPSANEGDASAGVEDDSPQVTPSINHIEADEAVEQSDDTITADDLSVSEQ
ncbi:MAG: SMC-Scp complex subunit ScpB [Pseudomonadota bacterium]